MSSAKQVYQLQEVDIELESGERTLRQKTGQLGESQEVIRVRNELSIQRQHLDELRRQQHTAEWKIDDLTDKINTLEQRLYDGSIGNPKELASLQHEVEGLKAWRSQLEDKALEIMAEVELAEDHLSTMSGKLEVLEAQWQRQQQRLNSEIEELKTTLADLEHKRQAMITDINPGLVNLYQEIKKQKGTAVARVDQGMCRGCQISLPSIELRRARGGELVRCGSCGRILFLA